MPRKLNKLPEAAPSRAETPADMPAAQKESPKIPSKSSAEILRLNAHEETRGKNATEELRAQISETSKDDKILEYAAAKNKQEAIIKKAEAAGLTSAQFYQMLENGPLDDQPERFGKVKNFFRRLAGQAWAGKDAAQLNKLMDEYVAAETIVNAPAQKDLENIQAAPRSRSSIGGSRIVSRGDGAKGEIMAQKPEIVASNEEDESNPAGVVGEFIDKYDLTIGKEKVSVAELVKNKAALNVAFNQVNEENESDAKALALSIAEIRTANFGSAHATEDATLGRATAAGRQQHAVGTAGMKTPGRAAGASELNPKLNKILEDYDISQSDPEEYKALMQDAAIDLKLQKLANEEEISRARAELAEDAQREVARDKAMAASKKRIAKTEADEAAQEAHEYSLDTIKRVDAVNAEFDKKQEQIDREVRWLAAFSKEDAKTAFKLMAPDAPAARLKEVNGNTIADTYRAMLNEEAVLEAQLKRKAPSASKEKLKSLTAKLDAVRSFASTVTVELTDADIEITGEIEKPRKVTAPEIPDAAKITAAERRAQKIIELNDDDIELMNEVKKPRSATPPEVPFEAMVRAAEKQKNKAKEEEIPFFSDADVELIEDEVPVKASKQDIKTFAEEMNKRSGKGTKSGKNKGKKSA